MTIAACDIQDVSFSLTGALHHVMSATGHAVSPDDLHAALGLSLMICASADTPTDCWPSLARDAFLPETCKLFGITVRDLHPPEAARGLQQAEAFEQHFTASYLPHIERALENGQAVLAWQGWSGRQGEWGIVTQSCDEGVGIAGVAFAGLSNSEVAYSPEVVALSRPPLQVYVIETNEPSMPGAQSLIDVSLSNMKRAWSPAIGKQFGILVGASAAQRWMELATVNQESWDASIKVASSWSKGCMSFLRFIQQHQGQQTPENSVAVNKMTPYIKELQNILRDVLDWSAGAGLRLTNMQDGRLSDLIDAIHDFQRALEAC